MRQKWFNIGLAVVAAVALIIAIVAMMEAQIQYQEMALAGDVSNFSGIHVAAPTAMASTTPGLMVDAYGVNLPFEVRKSATPVAYIDGSGNVSATGMSAVNATFSGYVDIGGLLKTSFTNLTVTDGYTLTPAYTVYALDTAGAVTITLAASADEGQILILINDDANATIIADTNLRSSDGGIITLAGAYDIVIFVYQDSEWLELAKTADS